MSQDSVSLLDLLRNAGIDQTEFLPATVEQVPQHLLEEDVREHWGGPLRPHRGSPDPAEWPSPAGLGDPARHGAPPDPEAPPGELFPGLSRTPPPQRANSDRRDSGGVRPGRQHPPGG